MPIYFGHPPKIDWYLGPTDQEFFITPHIEIEVEHYYWIMVLTLTHPPQRRLVQAIVSLYDGTWDCVDDEGGGPRNVSVVDFIQEAHPLEVLAAQAE